MKYSDAIRAGFSHLLANHDDVFAIGQGVWSPWYVGQTMKDLDLEFGRERVIDTPVSENATTGAAIGAALAGYRPIVIHPRMDFMILASDPIVNQASKWSHMLGGQASPSVTIRGIINRGGEQGAQHSQALHAWFAHVPGLQVVMPASPADARDLLISAVLSDSPTLYIDDRWLYDREADVPAVVEQPLLGQGPRVVREGTDVTLAGAGFAAYLCEQAADELAKEGISAEVVDIRVLNPLDRGPIIKSVEKTGNLCAVDSGTLTSGFAAEIVASVAEHPSLTGRNVSYRRVCLPDAPAPTSRHLEEIYYTKVSDVVAAARSCLAK